MTDINHTGIKEMLLYIKGNIRDENRTEEIALHLAECSDCLSKLQHLEYIMKSDKNFEEVWAKHFAHDPETEAVYKKIFGWLNIAVKKADYLFSEKLLGIRNRLSETAGGLKNQLIPVIETTLGSGKLETDGDTKIESKGFAKVDDLIVYFNKDVDLDVFKHKKIINGNLILCSEREPDFRKVILIEQAAVLCSLNYQEGESISVSNSTGSIPMNVISVLNKL